METYRYPLLYWKINDDLLCGRLVGTEYEISGTNLGKMQGALTEQLQREYQEYDYLPEPLSDPRLKIINVSIRPTYQEEIGIFPAKSTLILPVAAVYGATEYGYSECYLPLIDQHFYFYRPEQLKSLIEHFARDHFTSMPPERLHRLLLAGEPTMHEIVVRVRPQENSRFDDEDFRPQLDTLPTVADAFPDRGRKHNRIAPETAWERAEWVTTVIDKIMQENASVLLIGEPGIGKTMILLEAARKFSNLTRKRSQGRGYFWRTTPQRMVAKARFLGEWQESCEKVIDELQRCQDVLWVNDFIHMMDTGGDGPEDSIAAFMLPNLRQGQLRIVGEMTPEQWDKAQRRLPGFLTHFHVVRIPRFSQRQIQKISRLFSDYVQKQLKITVEETASNLAARLLERYLRYQAFPGKFIQFMTACINHVHNEQGERVDREVVLQQFIEKTGLPALLLRDEQILDTEQLQQQFRQRIVGQEAAVTHLCEVITIFKAGLNDPDKPIATLLFAGPTGVGKTACARALADYFFGKGSQQHPLIRLDMSEFQHPFQVDRLLGAGKEPGKLISEVRNKPFSVVLLDEIEKAHPQFFDVLLNLMDEGILIDGQGRVTDFRNTIIIMTSNLGAQQKQSIQFVATSDNQVNIQSAVRQFFRPEFFNRIDQVVTFSSLDKPSIEAIVKLELSAVAKREGLQERQLQLRFDDSVIAELVKVGFDPEYGARPLQRSIERFVVAKLAAYLLQHPDVHDTTLSLRWEDEQLWID